MEKTGFAGLRSTVAVIFAIIWLAAGCGRHNDDADDEKSYRRLASRAIALFAEVEPLGSSRVGITSSDSLLFTFSPEEIKSSVKRLKRLEAQFSSLPSSRLAARDVAMASVIIYRLRGEIFALETLESYRSSPLLYCRMIEEALWDMPSRLESPYEGELEAYRKRIRRISPLLASAGRCLHNPAEWHVRFAIETLDSLDAGFDELAAVVEKRYGTGLDGDLEQARGSILDFRRFASDVLLPAAYGTLILGSENLSKILFYDEIINADQNAFVLEAEKRIIQCTNEKNSAERRIGIEKRGYGRTDTKTQSPRETTRAAKEPFESKVNRLMAELWTKNGADSTFGKGEGVLPILHYPAKTGSVSPAGTSILLSLAPVGESAAAEARTSPFSFPTCRPNLFLAPEAARIDEAALRFDLLRAAPRMLELDVLRCQERDSVGTVFSSETFDEGWRYLAMQDLSREIMKNDPALYVLMMEDQVKQFARMIIVFKLHAGTLTSEGAIRYLVESTGMARATAEEEVLSASIAPSRAYPAIAMILIEQMLRNVSYERGYGNPGRDLEKVLRESRDVPLSLIIPKTESD